MSSSEGEATLEIIDMAPQLVLRLAANVGVATNHENTMQVNAQLPMAEYLRGTILGGAN